MWIFDLALCKYPLHLRDVSRERVTAGSPFLSGWERNEKGDPKAKAMGKAFVRHISIDCRISTELGNQHIQKGKGKSGKGKWKKGRDS